MANLETVGYKRMETVFSEEIKLAMAGDSVALSDTTEDRKSAGGGVHTFRDFSDQRQGALLSSSNFFDFAIQGPGFFGLRDSEGQLLLTRQGSFTLQSDGRLTDAQGRQVEMTLLPEQDPQTWKAERLTLTPEGHLLERNEVSGETVPLGRLLLYDVRDRGMLAGAGASSFKPVDATALYSNQERPEAFGSVKAYTLERSNVNLLEEMTQLLMTQRAYQLSTKAVGSADEMLQVINEIL